MPSLKEMLTGGPLLTDGAWGTQLHARGLPRAEMPDAWNLTHPDSVRSVAAAYVAAGSKVVLTNTFRANRLALADCGLQNDLRQINAEGVALSRDAAGSSARVFASIGPSGKMLRISGMTPDAFYRAFAEQAEVLASAGADALLLETMSDLEEARIAVRAAKQTGLPVIVSFAFVSGNLHHWTPAGLGPEDAAVAMEAAGADAVGANCGNGMEDFAPLCARMRAVTRLPLWMKANAGLPEIVNGEAIYNAKPDGFAAFLPALLEAGASFVGGCCGTAPEFIAALAAHWPVVQCGSA